MPRALIIGSGVAGPVVGMALHRAGIEAAVFEAHIESTKDVGSYLTVATNGLAALHAIDANHAVRSAGFSTPAIVLSNDAGVPLGRVRAGTVLADGTVSITIRRDRLHRVLVGQAKDRAVPFEFGKRLTAVEKAPSGGLLAHFQDGTQATGDLLVGCDGVHSTTRRIIDPAAPAGRYVGLINFGGYTRDVALAVERGVWHMVFGKRAFFGYVIDPLGGIVWFVNAPRGEVSDAERQSTSAEQWKDYLIELFAGDCNRVTDIIAAGEFELVADNTYDLPKVPTWHRGPIILLGDTAHAPSPSSGQGASLAIGTPSSSPSACATRPACPTRS